MPTQTMHETILILSGTSEALELAQKLRTKFPKKRLISSLAGRTKNPKMPVGEVRVGGFGGIDGLIQFIKDNNVVKIYDATHPFAQTISKNAKVASECCNIHYERILRTPWKKLQGDNWHDANSIENAAKIIPENARVFLALGSQYIKAFAHRDDCHFIARMINPPTDISLNSFVIEQGLPSQNLSHELALFKKHQITHLVARNSGGQKSYTKIKAARAAKIPVIMIKQPKD